MITETPSLVLPRVLPLPPDLLAELRQRLGFAGSAVLLVMGDGSQATGGLPQPAGIPGCRADSGKQKTEIENDGLSTPQPQSLSHTERSLPHNPHPACGHPLPRLRARDMVEAEREEPVSEDVARSAFALLQKLELDAPLKAPSALTVFRLYCVDGHSAERVARKCRCAKGTVMSRLRFIEERTGVKADQFRAMSGHLQQVDDDLRASGAREIYRRGLVGDERED